MDDAKGEQKKYSKWLLPFGGLTLLGLVVLALETPSPYLIWPILLLTLFLCLADSSIPVIIPFYFLFRAKDESEIQLRRRSRIARVGICLVIVAFSIWLRFKRVTGSWPS